MFVWLFILNLYAQTLEKDARPMVDELRMNMLTELKRETAKNPAQALEYCHLSAARLTQEQRERYTIGRTSHKLRNPKNAPAAWMQEYFKKFAGTQKGALPMSIPLYHSDPDGKRTWFSPIYVEPLCLQCHGDKLTGDIQAALKKHYPQDRAIGFKPGEFRGFFWVKEK